jgi:Mce-associated membrane protein
VTAAAPGPAGTPPDALTCDLDPTTHQRKEHPVADRTPASASTGATTTDPDDTVEPITPAGGPAVDSAPGGDDGTGSNGRRRRALRRRAEAGDRAPGNGMAGSADGPVGEEPGAEDTDPRSRRGLALPLVPTLAVLLVLLLAACGYLWAARPGASAVRTDAYVGALQAARAGIVDVASFDYVTLDDDIEQIRRVTTGDLQKESVDQLDQRRQQITDSEAVVDTEVVGAAVGAADADSATVFAVIQSTQQSTASPQAQVQRYRIEVDLTRVDGRWLLSGITGR